MIDKTSYDLQAWREAPEDAPLPDGLTDKLAKDEDVLAIEAMPLADVKNAFRRAFPDIKDGGTELAWEGAGDSFQVSLGHKTLGVVGYLLVRCSFGPHESPETFQKLLDTCRALGCKIYDPQRGEFL